MRAFAYAGRAEKDEAPGTGGKFGCGFAAGGRPVDPGGAIILMGIGHEYPFSGGGRGLQ